MSSDSSDASARPEPGRYDRRSFLQTSGGVATGVAVTVLPTAAVLASPSLADARTRHLGDAVRAEGDVPTETVMAYVHDAERGEVTVVAGTSEMTYRDPVLAQRLLHAARVQRG